jgi:cellulose biosynthesis protein BcsQ
MHSSLRSIQGQARYRSKLTMAAKKARMDEGPTTTTTLAASSSGQPYSLDGKVISVFNFKGGVGKTTNTHELAWSLCRHGANVLLIDFDSQRSLSGLCLTYQMEHLGQDGRVNLTDEDGMIEQWGDFATRRNLPTILDHLTNPELEKDAELVCRIADRNNRNQREVRLVVGSSQTHTFDATISVSNSLIEQSLLNTHMQILAPYKVIRKMAKRHCADIVILDLNPTLSSLNKNCSG